MRILDQGADDSEDLSEILPEAQADMQGDANRYFANTLHGRFESLSSVRQRFDPAQMESLRAPARDSVRSYVRDFAADPQVRQQILSFADTVGARTEIDHRDLTYLQLAHGLNPLAWATREKRQKAPAAASYGYTVDDFGNVVWNVPLASTVADVQLDGSLESDRKITSLRDSLEFNGTMRDSVELGEDDRYVEDENPYPRVPKAKVTLVDSMSVLRILDQPRPFTEEEIRALFQRVGEKDPFAASVLGKTQRGTLRTDWLLSEATAKEAQRILHEELGVDLTYKGVDFSRPADWLHRDGPNLELDPGRTLLVNGLLDLAVSYAKSNRLSPAGALDIMSPFGVVPVDRRYRSEQGSLGSLLGRVRASLGEEVSPYMLDLKDPLLAMLFPEASNWKTRGQQPVQDYFREASDFLLSWALPGTNVKDIRGRHWVPGRIPTSVYRTINNLREEFGAPAMGTILTDEAQIRPVSFLKDRGPDGFTRGWFGFNPFGKELQGWGKVRNAFESQVIEDPVLSPASTMSRMSFIGGKFYDPYAGDTLHISNSYKLNNIEWSEKRGKWVIDAPRVSSYQLDHMVPLAYLWEHGYDRIAEEIMRISAATPDGAPHEAPSFLRDAAILGGAGDGSRLPAGSSPERTHAMALLEFMSRAGLAANPDQFHLVSAKLNQEKGAKGPGGWVPFYQARTEHEHEVNAEYIRAFRSVLVSERAKYEAMFGRVDPNFLREDRRDHLAMRRIDLGLDRTGRFTRWAADAYLSYFDSPNLEDPTLYHSIRAWMMVGEASLSSTLALWQYNPFNQLYLYFRPYIMEGAKSTLFAAGNLSLKQRGAAYWKWIRERQAGTPLLGARGMIPGLGDQAIFTLNDIARSGRVQDVSLLSNGEIVRSFTGKFYAAHPSSILKYATGQQEAFGPDVLRGVRRRESALIPGFRGQVHSLYEQYLFEAIRAEEAAGASPQAQAWAGRLSDFELQAGQLYAKIPATPGLSMSSVEAEVVELERRLLRPEMLSAVSNEIRAAHGFYSSSQVGRELLRPTPFIQDIVELLHARNFKGAGRQALLEGLVKLVDYGVRGSLGTFAQLPAVLAIESLASKSSQAMQVMANVRPVYGTYDFSGFKGGLFGWYREEMNRMTTARSKARVESLAAIAKFKESRARAMKLRSRMDRLSAESPKLKSRAHRGQWSNVPHLEKPQYDDAMHRRLGIYHPTPEEDARELAKLEARFAEEQRLIKERGFVSAPEAPSKPLAYAPDASGDMVWADGPGKLKGQTARVLKPADEARMRALVEASDQLAAEYRVQSESMAAIRSLLEARRQVDRTFAPFVKTIEEEAPWIPELERAQGLRGRLLRFAAQHPRATYNVAKLRNIPGDLGRSLMAPIRLHQAVSQKLSTSTRLFSLETRLGARMEESVLLRFANRAASLHSISRAGGAALNTLGFLEIGSRHLRANSLASTSWDRLSTGERGELQAYLFPSTKELVKEKVLDIGIPLVAPLAFLGASQALVRDASRASLRAKIPMLRDEVVRRAVFNQPTLLSDSRIAQEIAFNKAVGLVDDSLASFTPTFYRDSTAYLAAIRAEGAKRKDKAATIEKELARARKAFQLIPSTDSLGYGPGKRLPGRELQRSLFQQAPMAVSPVSLVIPARTKTVPVKTSKVEAMTPFDRRQLLAEEASRIRRDELFAIAKNKKRSFFERFGAAALAIEAGPRELSGGVHADSAAVAKEIAQREALRARSK